MLNAKKKGAQRNETLQTTLKVGAGLDAEKKDKIANRIDVNKIVMYSTV